MQHKHKKLKNIKPILLPDLCVRKKTTKKRKEILEQQYNASPNKFILLLHTKEDKSNCFWPLNYK